MKNLSIWASKNQAIARLMLVIIHLLLIGIAGVLGASLFLEDILIRSFVNYCLVSVFLLGYLFYPIKDMKSIWWKHSYTRQKTFDILIATSTFLLMICNLNQGLHKWIPSTAEPMYFVQQTTYRTGTAYTANWNKQEKRAWRKELKQQVKAYKKKMRQERRAENKSKGKFWKILLLVGAGGLLFGVGSLSCGFICAGSEGPAALISVGGFGYASFLAVSGTRQLIKGKSGTSYKI